MKRLKLLLVILVLSIFLVPSAQAVDYGEILSAETRTGSITNAAQTDSFTFNGEAGQTVVISMSEESGILYPSISLYAPDGTLETSAWGDNHAEINQYQLLQSGTYTIVADDAYGTHTGNYSLSLTKIPGTQYSPSVRIILNQITFTTGEELIVQAHLVNGPDPARVEIKLWLEDTDGRLRRIPGRQMIFLPPNADITKEVFGRPFTADEPAGNWNVGGRLLNPIRNGV